MTEEKKEKKKDKDVSPVLLAAEPSSAKGSSAASAQFNVDVQFPVYAIDWIEDNIVLLAGGGGGSRTGVRNRLSLYKIDTDKKEFHLLHEENLSKEEDAPMTAVVHLPTKTIATGINSSPTKLLEGINNNLRTFEYTPSSMTSRTTLQTIHSTSPDDYQKVTSFSRLPPSSTPSSEKDKEKQVFLGVGHTNSQFTLLKFPEMEEVWEPEYYDDKDEIYDVDFNDSGNWVMATSSRKLQIFSTTNPTSSKDESTNEPILVATKIQTISSPTLKKDLTCTFRAAKFGRLSTSTSLFTIVNTTPFPRSRRPGKNDKKSYVSRWNCESWKLELTRVVGMKPVTAFDVSQDGLLLAIGSADLTVSILSTSTLRPITTILKAHDFPVTSLKFNLSATLLISGSADNSVRVIKVPSIKEREGGNGTLWTILITLFVVILAILIQMGLADEVMEAARNAVGIL